MPLETSIENKECFINERIHNLDKVAVRRKVCCNLPVKYEYERNYYCILHLPIKDKVADFNKIFDERINNKNYNFQGIWFPDKANLSEHKFEQPVDFREAIFNEEANFKSAIFSAEANFHLAVFTNTANFHSVTFSSETNFASAKFKTGIFERVKFFNYTSFSESEFALLAKFDVAEFHDRVSFDFANFSLLGGFIWTNFEETSKISFRGTSFKRTGGFTDSIIKGYIHFEGALNREKKGSQTVFEGIFNFKNNRIENPERISFHSVRLQPSMFDNADCRKFIFTDCQWKTADGSKITTQSELKLLTEHSNPNAILAKTCWQLADNYEEIKNFERASSFRQMANESMRLKDYKGFKVWSLRWWYWLSSFYGESWKRALAVLFGIWFIFTVIYTQVDFNVCPQPQNCKERKLSLGEAMKQSFGAMFIQKSEYRKPLETAETFTLFENILAPLQAALLALAIRRKFMR